MITNNKNILSLFSVILLVGLIFSSCDDEDYTGYSTLKPVEGVTLSVTPSFTSSVTMVEKDSIFEYTLTLSQAQRAEVKVFAYVTAATATVDEDFSYTGSIIIPAGKTSAKGKITVLSDELIEETETFTIQIGDQTIANVTYTPVSFDFTIQNYTTDQLTIDMSWDTDALDVTGLDLDPEEVGDLRLLIYNDLDVLVGEADGSGFETYSALNSKPDGDYYIAADFYATVDLGDFNDAITFDVTLDFFQPGIMDGSLEFPAVFDNLFPCNAFRVYLAKVTKTGSTYTYEKEISYSVPPRTAWYGYDAYTVFGDYPSEVETADGCNGELLIYGLNAGWMFDFWGETIMEEGNVRYEINPYTNEVTIADQYIFTTLYDGDLYDYTISGSGGIYDDSGTYPTMTIHYVLDQDGFDPSEWAYNNGYQATPYFEANLTLDPAGKSVISVETTKKFDLKQKPVH